MRKSNKIAATPTLGLSAVVTPSTKMREREQANTKKIKQGKKKGLEDFFGQGPRVSAPLWEGTPFKAVVQQRENRSNDGKGGDKPHLSKLVSLNESTTAYATKKLQAEGGRERGKKDRQTMGKRTQRKRLVRARMTRTLVEANVQNQMTKFWPLRGNSLTASRLIWKQ